MIKDKKKIIILSSIIIGILVVGLGITYSVYTFNKQGTRKSELIAGDIYMHFNETNNLNLVNAMPRDTYDNTNYFEFIIDGKNTTTNKDIWYEIVLSHGDDHQTRTERIKDNLLKFRLVEVVNNQETELVNNVSFNDLTNQKIWVDTINRNVTEEITKTYRLYMWIASKTKICSGDIVEGCDYYLNNNPNWDNVYASINVNVNGDFTEKTLPYNYLAKKNTSSDSFWPTPIYSVRENIIEVNFINLTENEINQRYQAAPIKEDVTDTSKGGRVLAWLEVDNEDTTKYKTYVASEGITYFPENSSYMFYNFTNLKTINFGNIDTSNVTNMAYMFYNCSSLTELDVSNFDTSNVTNLRYMFYLCSSLAELDVSNFDTSQVTNLSYMFSGCRSLTNLDISNFTTSQVTSLFGMFNSIPTTCQVMVRDIDAQNWVLTASNSHPASWSTSNVIVKN